MNDTGDQRFREWVWPQLRQQRADPELPAAVVTALDPHRINGYAAKALANEVATVAATTEGARNQTLNRAAFNLGTLVAAGHLDADTVDTELTAAARHTGLTDVEIRKTLASARSGSAEHPRILPDQSANSHLPDVTVLDSDADDFWTARPVLDHIRTFARARRACPWAVLGVILARVTAAVPPFVALPPLVGGYASLNMFIGLVGNSGDGKGTAEAVATDAVDVGDVETAGVGSGEGLAHMFASRVRGEIEQHTTAVLFTIPEIDTLTALGDRKGATLLPELRKAWSGERLGFSYADPSKRLPIKAHTYRLSVVAGIQPARGGALLDDSDAGTPQRFLWLPTSDPHAPDAPPVAPEPWTWALPPLPPADFRSHKVAMPICDEARTVIDTQRLARLRGEGEALNGHALLARLKAAAALAVLDGRIDVGDEDWQLAGRLHEMSDATRGQVQAELATAASERNKKRATAEAERQITVAERVEDDAIKRVCGVIRRRLQRADGEAVSHGYLRRSVAGRDRQHVEQAIERLVDAGQVTVTESSADQASQGLSYLLAKGGD